jgi:hypothetical protein
MVSAIEKMLSVARSRLGATFTMVGVTQTLVFALEKIFLKAKTRVIAPREQQFDAKLKLSAMQKMPCVASTKLGTTFTLVETTFTSVSATPTRVATALIKGWMTKNGLSSAALRRDLGELLCETIWQGWSSLVSLPVKAEAGMPFTSERRNP